jgi:site-specific DNA-methyltransferase (adenine-specific)
MTSISKVSQTAGALKLVEDVLSIGPSAVDFYATPAWLANAMVERAALRAGEMVLEPTCGDGAILAQIPRDVQAFGVEIDPVLAARARAVTGRDVIVGDVLALELPSVNAVVANPPFQQAFVEQLFTKLHRALVDGGRMVFLLSAHLFQTSTVVVRYAEQFSIEADLVPRDAFPGLQRPLVVATLRKDGGRRIVGIAFAREIAYLRELPATYRLILERSRTNVYVAAAERALHEIGRPATLDEINAVVEGNRPTRTSWWREALRRALAQAFVRVAPGTYALPEFAP